MGTFTQSTRWNLNILMTSGPPVDVVTGASAFWGLRPCTLASTGSNAIRLRRDSDQAEQDFVTIGSGLDLAAISAFKGAANLFVTEIYDQIGTNHLTQVTAAQQPTFVLSAFGALPGISFSNANHTFVRSVSTGYGVPPISVSAVIKPASTTGASIIGGSNGDFSVDVLGGNLRVLKQATAQIATTSGAPVAINTAYTVGADYDGTNFSFYVNGASVGSGSNVVTGITQTFTTLGDQTGQNVWFDGYINEWIVYPSYLDAGKNFSLSANQRSYWGF